VSISSFDSVQTSYPFGVERNRVEDWVTETSVPDLYANRTALQTVD